MKSTQVEKITRRLKIESAGIFANFFLHLTSESLDKPGANREPYVGCDYAFVCVQGFELHRVRMSVELTLPVEDDIRVWLEANSAPALQLDQTIITDPVKELARLIRINMIRCFAGQAKDQRFVSCVSLASLKR